MPDKQDMKPDFLIMYEKNLCNVTQSCNKMGIQRETFYRWMRKDEAFHEKITKMRDVTLDFAESCLLKQMAGGNAASTIFFLKCQGKKRGYIERDEITVTHNLELDDEQQNRIAGIISARRNRPVLTAGDSG